MLYFCFGPDAPTVVLDDSLDGSQANAGSFEFILAMTALENAEEFARVFHVEPGAVVADEINHFLTLLERADFNLCWIPATGVFEGISHQIGKNLLDEAWILCRCGCASDRSSAEKSFFKILTKLVMARKSCEME